MATPLAPFYTQADQDIYAGGQHFIPQEQYRLGYTPPEVMGPNTGITNTQAAGSYMGYPSYAAWLAAQGGGGGGGGGLSDYGLDMSNMKTFNKKVYLTTGPKKGWSMQQVTGYYDPASQTYKTAKGKNIIHGGLFTGDPKKGDIEETPLELPGITGEIINWLKNRKDQIIGTKEDVSKTAAMEDENITTDVKDTITTDGKVYTGDPSDGAYSGGVGGIHTGEGTGGQTTQAAADLAGDSWKDSPFAQGGRAGFQGGGGPAGGASAGGDYGGNVNPEQEYAGRTFQDTYGGDVSNQEEGLINKLNISPVMETSDTALGWDMPTGKFGLESLSKIGQLKALIDFRHLIESGGEEANPEFSYQGKAGPIDINATYADGAKNINASIQKGNWSGGIGTDLQGRYGMGIGYNTGNLSAGASADSQGKYGAGFKYSAPLPLGWWEGNNGGLVGIL